MPTPSLQTEDIMWAVLDTLQSQLTTALDQVSSQRTRQPLALPHPFYIRFGTEQGELSDPVDTFPRVRIVAAPRDPDQVSDQRLQTISHDLNILWLVIGSDEDEAALMTWRYGQAILNVLLNSGPYAGFNPASRAPRITEAPPIPYFNDDDDALALTGWLAGGEMVVPLKGVNSF